MNIEEIYEQHYYPAKSKKCRANTMVGYDSSVRLHVLPKWGAYEIDEIDSDELDAWCDSFEQRGAAKKAFKCLRQIVRWSIRKFRLRVCDPTQYVDEPKTAYYKPEVLDASELVELQRGFFGHELEGLVLAISSLGSRRGEGCAINPSKSINWKTGAVDLGPTCQVIDGEIKVLDAKTPKSNRKGYLHKYVLNRMKQICRNKTSLLAGLTPDQAARRIESWCKKNDLPHVSMTNLRHTWATLAIEAGVGIETVAMMLGHTNLSTAYEHYIVPRKTICQEAQAKVEKLIFDNAPKPKLMTAAVDRQGGAVAA